MSNPQAPAPNALPNMTSEVFITRTAAFLPFDPVSNDDMESVLGMVGVFGLVAALIAIVTWGLFRFPPRADAALA